MKLNRLNTTFLILITLCFLSGCGGSDAAMYDHICQNGTPKDGQSLTENENKCQACDEGYLLDANTMSCTVPSEPLGMGTEASPYVLLNYAHLKTMRDGLNKHYKLGADIDAKDSWSEGASDCDPYTGDGALPTGSTPCTGWVPVGGATHFTGSLDGNGRSISNLYVRVQAHGGLFGVTGIRAKIKNVGLVGIYLYISGSGTSLGGGLVGGNGGVITNSYATGRVVVSSSFSYAGGLVGGNAGSIINSYAASSVNSTFSSLSYGGGLVGSNGGVITNSYATGKVTLMCSSASEAYGGGLVGLNTITTGTMIMNSYATGNVSLSCSSSEAVTHGGGLVGLNAKTIENSYATGNVACLNGETCTNPRFGGLVGENTTVGENPSNGVIGGTNYFVHNAAGTEDDDGVHTGGCTGTCAQATGATAAARHTWMRDTLNEAAALSWNAVVWANLNQAGFPRLKYAEVAGFCSNRSYTTKATCEAATNRLWLAAGTECEVITPSSENTTANNGAPTPDCGDLIGGQ